jgi:hypothetical protein
MHTIPISAYKPFFSTKQQKHLPGGEPYETEFFTEMQAIRDGQYADVIAQVRAIEDKNQRHAFKAQNLRAITISAVCNKWRGLSHVDHHTGLMNIDIDAGDNPHISDWPAMRDIVGKLKPVIACFLSASGQGMSFVVRVKPDIELHKDTFYSICDELKDHLNIVADVACSDVVRLRFVSHDPGAIIKTDWQDLPVLEPSPKYLSSKVDYQQATNSVQPVGEADTEYNYQQAVNKANQQSVFGEGSKHNFLISVAGSCNIMGMSQQFCESMTVKFFADKTAIRTDELLEPVRSVYRTYKSQHATFDKEAYRDSGIYKATLSIVRNHLHWGHKPTADELSEISKVCEVNLDRLPALVERIWSEFAVELNYANKPEVDKVEIFMSKKWRFYRNIVTSMNEYEQIGHNERQPANVDEIYRQLQKARFKYKLDNIKSLLRSDFVLRYDPIADYFQSLPVWDQKESHIDKLASYITADDPVFWRGQFKKALVRSINCGLGLGINRIVIVLQQPGQDTGKSTFIRHLNPFGMHYYTEAPLREGKDTEFRFAENFIYNLEELSSLSTHDIDKLKAIISKYNVKERKPFAINDVVLPRRCNFWGSTNKRFFLQDDQNTRWVIIPVTHINWSYKQEVDMAQVWAEAWHLYKSGFDYQLTADERATRDAGNEEYKVDRHEHVLLLHHFKPCQENDQGAKFMTASEVAAFLGSMYPSQKFSARNVGIAIAEAWVLKRTARKISGAVIRGYWFVVTREGFKSEATWTDPGSGAIVSDVPF